MSAIGRSGTSSAVQMVVVLTGHSIGLGLHRAVIDAEAAAEQLRDPQSHCVGVCTIILCHMDGSADIVVAHRPDMKIVEPGDAGYGDDLVAHVAQRDPTRNALQQ